MTTVEAPARAMTPSQARKATEDLIREHQLTGWTVKFDNARRRAGQCAYRARVISLSKPLMAQRSYEDTVQTITHEIAHAIVGSLHGHDGAWARKHRELGGNGKRCFSQEGIDPTAPWIGTCSHGVQADRFRRPKDIDSWRCRCPQGSSPVIWKKTR